MPETSTCMLQEKMMRDCVLVEIMIDTGKVVMELQMQTTSYVTVSHLLCLKNMMQLGTYRIYFQF